MKNSVLAVCGVVFLGLWQLAGALDAGADTGTSPLWGSLGGGAQRTGLSVLEGPTSVDVQRTFATNAPTEASVVLDKQGRMYIACANGVLYCLKSAGGVDWTYDANSPLTSAPTITPDGTIVIGCESGALHALDPSGALKWKYQTGGSLCGSAAAGPSGILVFGSNDGSVYALDNTGLPMWKHSFVSTRPTPPAVFSSPALADDGTIYIGAASDPNLYALNPADGAAKWTCKFPRGTGLIVSPVVGPGGLIYQMLGHDDSLYAVRQKDGAILWVTDLTDPNQSWYRPDPNQTTPSNDAGGWSEPVLGPDGTIYVSLTDPYLRAVNPDGTIKWGVRLGDFGTFTLTVDKAGRVYAACDGGYLYVVDPAGRIVAQTKADQWLSYPVIGPDHTVIVSDPTDHGLSESASNRVLVLGAAM